MKQMFRTADRLMSYLVLTMFAAVCGTAGQSDPANNKALSITSPVDGTTFVAPADIPLVAMDVSLRIVRVEFFQGTTSIGIATNNPYVLGPFSIFSLTWQNVHAGQYTITAKGTDREGSTIVSAPVSIKVSVSPSNGQLITGVLRHEVYANIAGIKLADLTNNAKFPNNPDTTGFVNSFETPADTGENYGARVSGFILPPKSGEYIFYIASDDEGALFLSTDDNPANKALIAHEKNWSMPRQWTHTNQDQGGLKKSEPIHLVSGRRYYVEALMKEGGGGDHLAVAWQLPGHDAPANGGPPIPGKYLATSADLPAPIPPIVTIHAVDEQAAEPGDDTGRFRISRSGGIDKPLTVYLAIDGKAANGVDYQRIEEYVTILAGSDSAEIVVRPINDELVEGPETVVLRLIDPPYVIMIWPPPPPSYIIGTPHVATVTIADDDTEPANKPPVVAIASPQNGAQFAAPADIAIWAHATDPDGWVRTVEFFAGSSSLGIATNNPLIMAPINPFHITWSNVEAGNYVLTAKATDNGGRSATSDPAHISVTGPSTVMVVNIVATDPIATEPDMRDMADEAKFVVRRSGNTQIDLPVYLTITGAASNGVDYARITNVVVIPEGAESTEITISPLNDELAEEIETVILTLEERAWIAIYPPPPEMYTIGPRNTDTAFIIDTDSGTNAAAIVAITSPADGAVFNDPANILIKATAIDPRSYIYRVEFYAGSDKIGVSEIWFIRAPDPGEPIHHQFEWKNPPAGKHTLTVRATDNLGNEIVSAPVKITVTAPGDLPPVVSIVKPADGAEFIAHTRIEIQVEAIDPDGEVRHVKVLANSDTLGFIEMPVEGHIYSLTWDNPAPGNYTLRAQAIDNLQAKGESEPVTIRVRESQPDTFVVRELPAAYTPGVKLVVRLVANPPDGAGAYAVEDRPPDGWVVGEISHEGAFDPANGKVKFGPFFDDSARTLHYAVTPPADHSGIKEFSGSASADGASWPIGGDAHVSAQTRHPADNNPADTNITINEITAYGAAWKRGQQWPIDPNPIPINYVTRAGALWRSGEAYRFDPSAGQAPLWWVSLHGSGNGAALTRAFSSATADANTAVSELPSAYSPGAPFTVTITVMPAPGVLTYAVEDQPPTGWMVASINESGQYDSLNRKVKWLFYDDTPRTLTYVVTPPPNAAGTAGFDGLASFEAMLGGPIVPITGSRQIALAEQNNKPQIISITRLEDGRIKLEISAKTGETYAIESSADLQEWTTVGSVTPTESPFVFVHDEAASFNHRFYRVRNGAADLAQPL